MILYETFLRTHKRGLHFRISLGLFFVEMQTSRSGFLSSKLVVDFVLIAHFLLRSWRNHIIWET